ncbi:Uncharacterized protein Fot_34102 [Forsythia ovata]|uniref:Secreted protein n=1 Tax=Forsythia ovata TaxID=205694 RepID=A0ABD1SHN4_9LAMI
MRTCVIHKPLLVLLLSQHSITVTTLALDSAQKEEYIEEHLVASTSTLKHLTSSKALSKIDGPKWNSKVMTMRMLVRHELMSKPPPHPRAESGAVANNSSRICHFKSLVKNKS